MHTHHIYKYKCKSYTYTYSYTCTYASYLIAYSSHIHIHTHIHTHTHTHTHTLTHIHMKNDPAVVNPPQPFLRCHGTRMVPFFQLLPEPFVSQLHLAVAEGRGILHGKEAWNQGGPGNTL